MAAVSPSPGPSTMRAALGKDYGDIDEMISVSEDVPRPEFDPKKKKSAVLLRVLACALAPGDVRVLSGKTREVQGPPSLPYIPGGDVCGVVQAVGDGETRLKLGDVVVSQFADGPRGGLAEYYIVDGNMSAPKPTNLSPCEAAALGSSGAAAMVIANRLRPGERVLILGASGGVGTFLVQIAKQKGVGFIAATTTQTELLKNLGADVAVDYRTTNVWESDEFRRNKFDTVVDLVEAGWPHARKAEIVKSGWQGGRFLTTVPPDQAHFEVRGYWQAMKVFTFPILWRTAWTFFNRKVPRYHFVFGLGNPRPEFAKLFPMIEAGSVRVVLDPNGPHPFTTEGVRRGMRVQESWHAHGKVVVKVDAKSD
eukprot:Hpha_TRINITY_DN3635_c0_g1::TRINITY_DN3635_c0_g1_i1::g.860::m.860